jgi:hypothetical protein
MKVRDVHKSKNGCLENVLQLTQATNSSKKSSNKLKQQLCKHYLFIGRAAAAGEE